MTQLFANFAATTLASPIASSGATSCNVASAAGFPSPTGGDFFMLTLATPATGTETTHEIVKVTAVSGTTFTIVRGQEGTAATTWSAGDKAELRDTQLMLTKAARLFCSVHQVAHGFTQGTAVFFNGTTWELANASDASTLGVGLVNYSDADNFDVVALGIILGVTAVGPVTATNEAFAASGTTGQAQKGGVNITSSVNIASIVRTDWQGTLTLSQASRTNLLQYANLVGSGSTPTGWTSLFAAGSSSPSASSLSSAYGEQAYTVTCAANQQGWYQPFTALPSTTYSWSVLIESITGNLFAADIMQLNSVPAGGTQSYPPCPANPAGGYGTLNAGLLVMKLTTVGTGGSINLEMGAGLSFNATSGTVKFSHPQLEVGSSRTSWIPNNTSSPASIIDYSYTSAGVITLGQTASGAYVWSGTGIATSGADLTPGQYYFVSDSTPGGLTSLEPTTSGHYSNPIVYALTVSTGMVLPFRPSYLTAAVNYAAQYDFLIDSDPNSTALTYAVTRTAGVITRETWSNAGPVLVKSIDYTYSDGTCTQEVRKVFAADGTTIVAQVTVVYTYSGGLIASATSTRNV